MKLPLLILTYIAKIAGVISAFGVIPGIDPKTGIILFMIASCLKDSANRLGDILDDGVENQSFKVPTIILTALLIPALFFGGCKSTGSNSTSSTSGTAITTDATPTTNGWTKFLSAVKSAVHTGLGALQTVAKACYTITRDLPADEFAGYLKAFGVDDATIADAKAAYIQAGATAAAASKIAATIDGATVASQATSQ